MADDDRDPSQLTDDELLAEWRATKAIAQSLEGREPPAYPAARHDALEAEAKRRGLIDYP